MDDFFHIHSADDYHKAIERIEQIMENPSRELDMLLAVVEAYETGHHVEFMKRESWSRQAPTTPGWYWFSGDSSVPPHAKRRPIIIEVTRDTLHKATLIGRYSQGIWPVNGMSGDWFGPLDEPIYEEAF